MRATGRHEAAETGSSQEHESLVPSSAQAVDRDAARKQALSGQLSLFGWYTLGVLHCSLACLTCSMSC